MLVFANVSYYPINIRTNCYEINYTERGYYRWRFWSAAGVCLAESRAYGSAGSVYTDIDKIKYSSAWPVIYGLPSQTGRGCYMITYDWSFSPPVYGWRFYDEQGILMAKSRTTTGDYTRCWSEIYTIQASGPLPVRVLDKSGNEYTTAVWWQVEYPAIYYYSISL